MAIELVFASILEVKADVIVLSAQPTLLAGGGISGVIHKAAGLELEHASKPLGPLQPGSAVLTEGFHLEAKNVIHAVAPRYLHGDAREQEQLRATYRATLELNQEDRESQTIVFPAIGVGIYRWPTDIAAEIAIEELLNSRYAKTIVTVLDEDNYKAYASLLADY